MCKERGALCLCATGGILTIISKKWALLIINRLGSNDRLRFSDLIADPEGINPQALSETLKVLQEEGLVGRESFAETPPRVEYFLTPDGISLWEAILPLLQWASQRDLRDRDRCEIVCRRRICHPKGSPCARKQQDNNPIR